MRLLLRRLALAAFLGLAAAIPVATAVPVAAAAELTAEDRQVLREVERYLNGITTLKARFTQISSNGKVARGTFYLSRPGRLRFEYDPPSPVLLVADGSFLIFHDAELDQTSHIPLGQTPLGILLDRQVRLVGGDIRVTDVEQTPEELRVTAIRADSPGEGRVTLVFDRDPLRLMWWTVTDAQGVTTQVVLTDVVRDVRFDRSLFRFNPLYDRVRPDRR